LGEGSCWGKLLWMRCGEGEGVGEDEEWGPFIILEGRGGGRRTYGWSVIVRVMLPISSREGEAGSGKNVNAAVVIVSSRRLTTATLPTDELKVTSTEMSSAEMVMLAVALEKGEVVRYIADAGG
jgi:hypothetical protein